MSEVVLLLPNTLRLQQDEDYVRGCTTSTKYSPSSTNWRLCQRLYYFYQILSVFNKLKIMSEVVLLLPNTVCLQQTEDYVRGWQLTNSCFINKYLWNLSFAKLYFSGAFYFVIKQQVIFISNRFNWIEPDDTV